MTHTKKMNRDKVVTALALVSGMAGFASVCVAVLHRANILTVCNPLKPSIVGVWVLLPPIWFWVEWVWVSRQIDEKERERIKHMHDLARNIWIALLAILVGLFDIDVFKNP
jgi:hypothetical protein